LGKGLRGGPVVKAFARRIVVDGHVLAETTGREHCEIGFAGHEAAHPSDGILDAALLPGRVGITEEGVDRQAVKPMVACELGTVVEGDGLAQRLREAAEQPEEMAGNAVGHFVGQSDGKQQARLAFVHGQDRLTVFGEHHQIGFPVPAGGAIGSLDRAFGQGNAAFNEVLRAATFPAAAAAFALAARQTAPPAIVLGAGKLGVNEAVDTLIRDHLVTPLALEPAGNLLGRPTACEPLNDGCSQALIAFQA